MNNKFRKIVGLSSLLLLSASSVLGVELRDGSTAFTGAPRLLNATTTFNSVRVWAAKYYFTIQLPVEAGPALEKISFQQRQSPEIIRFSLDKTFAFTGTPNRRGENIPVQETILDAENNTITVIFDEPVSPGTTLTVGLKPVRNPLYSGVYLFRVTAFPSGEKPVGMDLGVGRLQFYQNGDLHR